MQQSSPNDVFANRTMSHLWRLGTALRYPELKRFEHVDIVWQENLKQWQSNTFFDFSFTCQEEAELLPLLRQHSVLFKYLDAKSHANAYLHDLAQRHGLQCHEESRWLAPVVNIPPKTTITDFLTQHSTRLKTQSEESPHPSYSDTLQYIGPN
ncbi:hypothetical protein LH67_08985 [Xenorhabdus nematophila]|nr:hypothetical protein LH67_08985 [Xenorhabdus nematophila]